MQGTEEAVGVKGLQLREELCHGDSDSGNLLVRGDSRLALPLLKEGFAGKVRCIYIDPPYNNGENFAHYNDRSSHADWLQGMDRMLRSLKHFLSDNGSIWISIDDKEMHYLKVTADRVFGRENFISTIVWQHRNTRENRSIFSCNHEYILVYARDAATFKRTRNLLPLNNEVLSRYRNPDNDPRGPWQSVSANVQSGHATKSQFYEVVSPTGKHHAPPNGRCWVYSEERMKEEIKGNNIWFGQSGNGAPRIKKFLNGAKQGLTPETLWTAEQVGTTNGAKKHLLSMFPDEPVFDTPKPEELIRQVLQIATDPGDLVLDCYLGSGSTASTALKMGRRFIGIERGGQMLSIAQPRLRMAVDGEEGGVSGSLAWTGGGGFDFYDCEMPLLV
jgi:adenine-specific DNA-methyltransferase